MLRTRSIAGLALLALTGLLFSLVFSATAAQARPAFLTPELLAIPPGQTAVIQLRGFCIDPGKLFPSGITTPAYVGDDAVRAGLYYAASKGYTQSNPFQVQSAIWFLQHGSWQSQFDGLAQE